MSSTDQPMGHRPHCPACGEHRWSFDGKCLSYRCNPLPWDEPKKRAARKPREKKITEQEAREIQWYREAMQ